MRLVLFQVGFSFFTFCFDSGGVSRRIDRLTHDRHDGCSCSRLVAGVGNARNETSGNFSFCSLSISSNARSLALALAISRSICTCSSAACNLIFSSNMERSAINLATLAFSFI